MNDRKESKIYRLLPCHKNDILAVEAWLENMAAEGNKVLHIDYYSPTLLGDLSVGTVAQIYADYLLNENSETK